MIYKLPLSLIWISLYPFLPGNIKSNSCLTSKLPFFANGCKQLNILVLPEPFLPVINVILFLHLVKSIDISSVLKQVLIPAKFTSFIYSIFIFYITPR